MKLLSKLANLSPYHALRKSKQRRKLWQRGVEGRLSCIEGNISAIENKIFRIENDTKSITVTTAQWRRVLPIFLNYGDQLKAAADKIRQIEETLGDFVTASDLRAGQADAKLQEHLNSFKELATAFKQKAEKIEGVLATVAAEANLRASQVDARLSTFAGQASELEQHVAALQVSVDNAWKRLDVVRRETLLEIAWGTKRDPDHAETKINDPEKFAKFKANGIRLNLGCGHLPLEGFLNVDMRDLPGVDIASDVGALPFEESSVQMIYSAHMVEHFSQEEFKRRLLPHWLHILAPGGELRIVCPDGAAMLDAYTRGGYSFEEFRTALFGGQEYGLDYHFNLFTPASLTELLSDIGYVDVSCLDRARRNGECYELEISARKRV